ncbi:hypothetical protein PDE_09958 [Penicillium oxalicum 114-2]|uniref:Uncharacterized protein n=1 Tax=Penicillium oxalicum (strain 114-2 / CGMCC 5302) TaxID=933388 RepID=S8B7N4_PENO1|nr:hypothetical protein PDE_09958 [Penicillium oxalicum 114-2]
MRSLSNNPMADRASLRLKYAKAASDLLKALSSDPKLTYSSNDLTKLRVSLGSFNPVDRNFITSNFCLFKPMSSEQVMEYSLDVSQQPEGTRNLCNNYDEMYQHPTGVTGRHLSGTMSDNAETTFLYLNRHVESSYKKTMHWPESLAEASNWNQIRDGNPFSDLPWGLLGGYSLTSQIPSWDVRADYEWQYDYRDPGTIYPHMMLVMKTGAVAIEGELLFCELGCITQVIQNRLQQNEFEKTSLFPVQDQKRSIRFLIVC